VRLFTADIIYHLFDALTKYMAEVKAARRAEAANTAVFPVVLEILPEHIYRQKNPILIGCKIKDGILKLGTPLCVVDKQVRPPPASLCPQSRCS